MSRYAPSLTHPARESLFRAAAPVRDLPLPEVFPFRVAVFSGRHAVLSQAGMLEDLASRSGQPGAMHGLAYLVDHQYTSRKVPHLVCLYAENGRTPSGAVVLFEHRIFGWNTRLFSTGDSFGVRTVVGPEPLRAWIAETACSTMLEPRRGIVLASFKQQPAAQTHPRRTRPVDAVGCLWASQTRLVRDHLPLAGTVDATLAQLGKRTRTHLRYYRRRLREAVSCDFLPDAAALIDPADAGLLERLNCGSLEPIAQDIFNLQYRSTALSTDGFVCGLRSKDGQWLALAGGWRQAGTTWVQWQTNTAAFPALSIGTAMRLFLIEQEVGRGTRTLAFHGGTSHSMAHAFPPEWVIDLIARRGWLPSLLVRVLPTLLRLMPSLSTRGNFLFDALRGRELRWTGRSPSSNTHRGSGRIG